MLVVAYVVMFFIVFDTTKYNLIQTRQLFFRI